tara:strand:+ start:100506 stop:101987 length:1482 start_codon:yes stop_codon:yes gene_type:complete
MNNPENNPLGALFLNSCDKFSSRVAIRAQNIDVPYAQLGAAVTHLASILHGLDIGRGALVGMHIGKDDIKSRVAVLALTLIGARWIEYGEYLNGHDSIQLTHLLHDDGQRPPERFSIHIDKVWPGISTASPVSEASEFSGFESREDTWVLPSSSGTTGARKTMAVSGGAFFERIVRLAEYDNDAGDFSAADLFLPYSVPSWLHFLHTVCLGGMYVLNYSYTYLLAQNVQLIVGSPHQLAELLQGVSPPDEPALQEVRVIGGALIPDFLSRLLRYFRVVRASYGSTETGPVSTTLFYEPASEPSLGRSYPDVEVEIVDEHDVACPREIEGIVRIRTSSQVQGGYIGQAEATAQAFRDGWFYPGDSGRLSADGEFHATEWIQGVYNFAGTKFNIAEMDSILQAGEAVQDALCFTELDEFGVETLAALIVLGPGADRKPAVKTLVRALLAAEYPLPLLPRNIYQVDAIPRNPNGKAMRHEAAALVAKLKPIAQVEV